jgi:hypothetical protein
MGSVYKMLDEDYERTRTRWGPKDVIGKMILK